MDLENLLNELGKLLADISGTSSQGRMFMNNSPSRIMGLDVSSNIAIKIGLSEYLEAAQQRQRPTDIEPLIDLFDKGDSLKIVVLLPGIKKDDVKVTAIDGLLVIEVRRGFQAYRKEIPCNIRADEIAVKAITSSNSVVEIILRKGREEEAVDR